MAIIPHKNFVRDAVEVEVQDPQRAYIGMSGIGHPCARKVWYDFRHCYIPIRSARQMRIFERGDIEEDRVVRDLTEAGMDVHSRQYPLVDQTGHIRGHIDGVVVNVPGAEKTEHLLEVKTMNNARFKDYLKKGLKQTSFAYYVQMNQYMGYLNLKRCLFVVTNKDNEERDYQRYEFDRENFDDYRRVAFSILTAEVPPPRIGEPFFLECKLCDAKEICHKGVAFNKHCRNCQKSSIEWHGKWTCDLKECELDHEAQKAACDEYDPIDNV